MLRRFEGNVLPRAVGRESGVFFGFTGQPHFYLVRLRPGTTRNGILKRLKATRTDDFFLLLCSFYPRLNFLGERQAGHQENKQASATSKPLKGS